MIRSAIRLITASGPFGRSSSKRASASRARITFQSHFIFSMVLRSARKAHVNERANVLLGRLSDVGFLVAL